MNGSSRSREAIQKLPFRIAWLFSAYIDPTRLRQTLDTRQSDIHYYCYIVQDSRISCLAHQSTQLYHNRLSVSRYGRVVYVDKERPCEAVELQPECK